MIAQPSLTSGCSHSFAAAYSFEAGREEMLRLSESTLAEAYFCGDDVLSIGALSALKDRAKRVPEDIGIIGLNDMEMAGWDNIDLTTIPSRSSRSSARRSN